ncbi:helix-turn-helix domain-containing protein [Streptomyces sp. NPDC020377]|uniref:helix-turn-helix domain-containing protein n=1 Tax=Streptomyces sp. NPDC020377 TaxID=3365070 RepID=UPI00378FEC1E
MHDEQNGHGPALTELRRKLAGGLARTGLNKTQLADRTGLGRTTVSQALSPKGSAPTEQTVAALARTLKLSVEELLELQRTAVENSDTAKTDRAGPGRPIGEWEPHALEVHPAGPAPAGPGSGSPKQRVLPGYVSREHDGVLAEVVREAGQGRSGIAVLVGTSSTGKTRACWEAVQPLANRRWRLWHPFDPTRAEAALEDLHRVRPRTVVWLNEAQHYFGDRAVGERIAAAVHHLLVSPERGPVLVLGTLWPEYAHQYTALPTAGREDPHSRVRELLSGHTMTVPEAFDAKALAAATVLAGKGDRLLADALSRVSDGGRVAQDLAGAPVLLDRYERATPAARALLEVAMDARRVGVDLHLPQAFLTDAASDYLTDTDYDRLTDDWAERAYAELAEPVHGKQAPLRSATPRPTRRPPTPATAENPASPPAGPVFRLADYLDQHGRTTRRHLCPPASFWHAAHTHITRPDSLNNLTQAAEERHRLQWAHHLRHRAADHGNPDALDRLAEMRERAGDREGAEALARQAAEHGHTNTLVRLAVMCERAGDAEGAERRLRQAADHGNTYAMVRLAEMCERAGDGEGAERRLRQAADHGNTYAMVRLAEMESAERRLRQAADLGNTYALGRLAEMRKYAGQRESAETLARQAADHDNTDNPLARQVETRETTGDRADAKVFLWQAADRGNPDALARQGEIREKAGDREGAETLARRAADHGDVYALTRLAVIREKAGDRESAETLARQAADHGNSHNTLARLADMPALLNRLWPDGLDPDGTPTAPWQPAVEHGTVMDGDPTDGKGQADL